ncbi:hypothetical protein POM88_001585 [Heracleum sosnowskyi]|uniref:DUF5637 domain-containing protein n=1 Tax=Heracleum sosnowskyi TaxID=360622 RepID=A0AAD8LVJ2_9APIA|nr:hypothetical protein POM88_055082 [Heracleum sosnowskyi]KAK1401980.1 hypothetical protein POM88_001585 [Heracleum sosnowskyi]
MQMKNFFLASLMVVLLSTLTSMASTETSMTAPLNNIVGNELIVRGTDGLMYYKKSPMPRSFLLPKLGNVADGGENCIANGGFCLGNPTGCCGNCGCLIIPGVCYGTDC